MGINLGNNKVELKLGTTTVLKAFLGSTQVYPEPSSVGTATISTAGEIKVGAGTYACIQRSTSGSGTGATFNIVLDSQGIATSISSITAGGSDYQVGDTITLDYTAVADNRELIFTVLTVATVVY